MALHNNTNSARFLKTQYLGNVDKIENHLYKYSINFKDVDLEYEWRLREIHSKKLISLIVTTFALIQDIIWSLYL
jgi:hypothetical protein